jgi:hypothetical protein
VRLNASPRPLPQLLLGLTVLAIALVLTGFYQVTPRNSTEVSDYGINDTSTREKDVTAVVSVTFGLEA